MASVPLTIDAFIGAALGPIIGVGIFWFLQLLFIETQKRLLSKLRRRHEAFCRFTNFIGILFQTICHALGYTVTRSGIASFQVTVNYGKVEPKKEFFYSCSACVACELFCHRLWVCLSDTG